MINPGEVYISKIKTNLIVKVCSTTRFDVDYENVLDVSNCGTTSKDTFKKQFKLYIPNDCPEYLKK